MPTTNLTKTPQLLSLAPGSTWTFQNTGPQRIAISQLTDGLVGSSITGWIGAGGSRDVLVPSNGQLYAFSEFNGVASIDYVERPLPGGTALGQFVYNGERAIFATQAHLGAQVCNGHSVNTLPRFFTRARMHVAAGRWKALAVVYLNWRRNTTNAASESDAGLSPVDIIGAGFELVAQPITGTRNNTHPNTGGLTVPVTFARGRDVRLLVGEEVVSDWILPSQFGLEFFEFGSRDLAPWVRTAFGSIDRTAGILLPSMTPPTNYSFFQQDYYAVPADDTAALALTAPSGATSRITGLTGVQQTVPTPAFLIGIPADGQKAVFVLGTSRLDSGAGFSDRAQTYAGAVGSGNGSVFTDGPADSSYLDLPGAVCKWLQDPEVSVPFFMVATGGGNMSINWSTFSGNRPTNLAYENPGANRNDGQRFLMQFADILINEHGCNDSFIGQGGYTLADYKAQHSGIATEFKRVNLFGKYIACFGPVSGYTTTAVALNPAAQTDANGNYNTLYIGALNELVTEGKVDFIWDWRSTDAVGSGVSPHSWGVSNPLVIWSGTTTTGSTTTQINLNGPVNLLKRRHYRRCVVRVDGVDRFISSNTGNTITLDGGDALPSAPGAGVTVEILGNYSHDGLHPSGWGEVRLAQDAKAKLNRFIKPINRPNTA